MIATFLLTTFLIHGGIFYADTQTTTGYLQGEPFDLQVLALPAQDMEGDSVRLEIQAAYALTKMMTAAQAKGHVVKINYGFRSQEQQRYWYNRYEWLCKKKDPKYCGMAAPPGWSSHQQGLSIDISRLTVFINKKTVSRSERYTKDMTKWVKKGGCKEGEEGFVCYTSLYYWLLQHAREYGFRNDVPGEPWHWTYQLSPDIAVGG